MYDCKWTVITYSDRFCSCFQLPSIAKINILHRTLGTLVWTVYHVQTWTLVFWVIIIQLKSVNIIFTCFSFITLNKLCVFRKKHIFKNLHTNIQAHAPPWSCLHQSILYYSTELISIVIPHHSTDCCVLIPDSSPFF